MLWIRSIQAKQCRDLGEVERTRAIEKSWNTLEIDWEDYRTSRVEMCRRARSHMISSGDQQNVFRVFRGKKHSGKKWLIRWSFEKISSVQSSQLSLEASAYRIQTDVNCQIKVSDFKGTLSRCSARPNMTGFSHRSVTLSRHTDATMWQISASYIPSATRVYLSITGRKFNSLN